VLGTVNADYKQLEEHDSVEFVENFRDDALKINDDRKIKFSLSNF
jgi:hypothetical protein